MCTNTFHHINKSKNKNYATILIYSKTALIKFKVFFIKHWVPKMRDIQEAFYKLKMYS